MCLILRCGHIPEAFLHTALAWRAGAGAGDPILFGLHTDSIDFVPNPTLDVRPASLLADVDRARDEIRAGTLVVPRVDYIEGAAESN